MAFCIYENEKAQEQEWVGFVHGRDTVFESPIIALVTNRKNVKCNNGNIYNICGSELLKSGCRFIECSFVLLYLAANLQTVTQIKFYDLL